MSVSYFRDVVALTESEYDLQRDLCTVRKRLTNFYTSPKTWVGITGIVTDFVLPALLLYLYYKRRFRHYVCNHAEFV
jgi:hypothetical protein